MTDPTNIDVANRATIYLHPAVAWLPFDWNGPLIRLPDGRIAGVGQTDWCASADLGRTWERWPLFDYQSKDKEYKISNERALCRTPKGTLVVGFMNLNERVWLWRDELRDALPGTRLPQYVMRSEDDGRTWAPPILLHEEWTGEVRDLIVTRSGRLVLSSMKLAHKPGRHTVLTYVSDDDGKSWQASHAIDLGGCGHHGGVTEATIAQLRDGRIWMLLRTNWGRFWQAFSEDEGLSWRRIEPSAIEASSAPGLLKRLASGRLVLLWNRPYPEGKTEYPLRGGDGLWSEVPVSNHRAELSLSFSEDEGQTFTNAIVIARKEDGWLSYPRLLEIEPGELWLTTMQGGLCVRLREDDFLATS
jgi:hypothetical protein